MTTRGFKLRLSPAGRETAQLHPPLTLVLTERGHEENIGFARCERPPYPNEQAEIARVWPDGRCDAALSPGSLQVRGERAPAARGTTIDAAAPATTATEAATAADVSVDATTTVLSACG